jgi:MFS family permease
VGCLSADRFGRKRTLYTATAAMLVFSLVCPQLLTGTQNFAGVLAFLCVGFSIMGALFGPCGAYLPELFPAKVRYSGSGLAYNLAAVTGGAFAPTIATALVTSFGIQALGWYLGIMAVIALVALYFIKESKDVDYEV